MAIIYSLISISNNFILADYSDFSGNFDQITLNLLDKIEPNQIASFSYEDKYYFHYLNTNSVTFICLSDEYFSSKKAYIFLEDLKNSFFLKYQYIHSIPEELIKDEFSQIIQKKISYYNTQTEYENTILSNDDNKKLPDSKSNEENFVNDDIIINKFSDFDFSKQSLISSERQSLRSLVRAKRMRSIFILIAILLLIMYLSSVFACSGFSWKECRNE